MSNLLWTEGQVKKKKKRRNLFLVGCSICANDFVRVTCCWVTRVDGSRNDDERNAPNAIMRRAKTKKKEKNSCLVLFIMFISWMQLSLCCLSMMMISALYCMNKRRPQNSNRKISFSLSLQKILRQFFEWVDYRARSHVHAFPLAFSVFNTKNKREEKKLKRHFYIGLFLYTHTHTRFSTLVFFLLLFVTTTH